MPNTKLPDRQAVKVPASIEQRFKTMADRNGLKLNDWIRRLVMEHRNSLPESPLVDDLA